jgi:flagellin
MGLRIQNNITALNAHRQLTISDSALSKSLERLSSGYRINRAADDAAGLAISQQFRADIASYKVASQNVSEANSLLQVAEGGMEQIGNMLTRLKELATQASSANAGSNVDKLNAEGNALIDEIDRIANSTEYAGTKLLNGSFGVTASSATLTAGDGYVDVTGLQSGVTYHLTTATGGNITIMATVGGVGVSQTVNGVEAADAGETKNIQFNTLGLTLTINEHFDDATAGDIVAGTATASNFQVGTKDSPYDRIGIKLDSVVSDIRGLGLSKDQLDSATNAQGFLQTIDDAISALSAARGGIGATQNRLGYASANLSITIENVTASESVIRDVDMAGEMVTFTKNQILLQAGTAMLAQANLAPQGVLSLFR